MSVSEAIFTAEWFLQLINSSPFVASYDSCKGMPETHSTRGPVGQIHWKSTIGSTINLSVTIIERPFLGVICLCLFYISPMITFIKSTHGSVTFKQGVARSYIRGGSRNT